MQTQKGKLESIKEIEVPNKETNELETVKFWDIKRSITLGDNYLFWDYFNRLILLISKGKDT